MTAFIDLQGASATVYRFRLAHPDELPASAGNFICMADTPQGDRVVCCGIARRLTDAGRAWTRAVKQHGADRLYVRLNVRAAVREHEHGDLVSALQPPLVVSEPD